MAERDLVRTGIGGLDDLLSGGIPRGNVILLEGTIGTGKTTTGVEFVYRGASEFDEPGIIVVFEVSPEKVVRDAAHFGWDLPALERQNRLKIIFTTRPIFRQELQQADSLLLEEAAKMGASSTASRVSSARVPARTRATRSTSSSRGSTGKT